MSVCFPGRFPCAHARLLFGLLCFLVVVFCGSPLCLPVAQTPAQSGPSFTMRVDVELVTTEVVVLDRNGMPVRNLKKENFRIYEDGKQQEIHSFDEVNEDAPRAASLNGIGGEAGRGKVVLILFDDGSIAPGHLKSARDSAEKFVKQHMNPQDLFAVASFDISLKILRNFTREPEQILDAIARPAISTVTPTGSQDSPSLQSPIRGADLRGPEAPGAMGTGYNAENLLRALNFISVSVEHLKGPKSVILYSESRSYNRNTVQIIYEKTVDSAKRASVAIYTIDPGGLGSGASAETPDFEGDSRTFSSGGTRNTTSSLGRSPAVNNPIGSSSSGQASLLKSLATETGESALDNTNDFDSELDKLSLRLSNYYILGFRSGNPKHDGAFHKLEVKTELKGVTLRHREGYFDRRPLDTLVSSRQEKSLLDIATSSQTIARVPVVFRAAYFYDSPGLAKAMIFANIRAPKLDFKKKGGQPASDLNVMGLAYDEDGGIAARFSETLHLAANKGKGQDLSGMNIAYRNYFKLPPGRYRLKLAVSDEGNNLGFAEQPLEVPALPEHGMAGSSLVLASEVSRLPDLIRDIDARLLDDSDPMAFSGLQVYPKIENKVTVDSPLPVFFKLYNVSGASSQPKLLARARLLGDKGEELSLPLIALDDNISRTGDAEAAVGMTLPFKGMSPGKYKLVIETSESSSSQTATVQTDIEYLRKD